MTGNCPKCSKPVEQLEIKEVPVKPGRFIRGVTYSCPHCKTILGVGANPEDLLSKIRDL